MKKTSLLLVLGLAVLLASAAAPKANAGVVIAAGVGIPVYAHPAAYAGPYPAPMYVARGYVAAYPYAAVAPARYYRRVYVGPVYHHRWYGRRFVYRDYDCWRR